VLEALEELAREFGLSPAGRIRRLSANRPDGRNSRSSPKTDWDRHETPPGFVVQLLQASGVPIDRYSFRDRPKP